MSVAHPDVLLRVEGLVNRFGDQVVHDHLDLDIRKGEILGLVGGSGSGKSVLVRSILGLNRPAAGHVWYQGKDILRASTEERRRIQESWGMLFQGGALFSGLTVLENIEFPMREHLDIPKDLRKELAELKIRLVGLPMISGDKFPSQLSGGMVKRASLARALALEPEVLFLDEPTAGLDPISADSFDELTRHLSATLNLTVVIVTHDLHSLVKTCDRIAVLVDKIVIAGTLDELLRHPHPWIREYFHGARMQTVTGAP